MQVGGAYKFLTKPVAVGIRLCAKASFCVSPLTFSLSSCLQSVDSFGGLVFAAEEQSEGIIPVKTHGIHSKSSNGK